MWISFIPSIVISGMPFYKITVTLTSGETKQGVRYDPCEDINVYCKFARTMAMATLKDAFDSIDVVMLSAESPDLQDHMIKRRRYFEALWKSQGKYTGKEKMGYRLSDEKRPD